jgi:hypothetical protein
MLDTLRKPFLVIAAILLFIAEIVEAAFHTGFGVTGTAELDVLLALALTLMVLPLIIPESIHGRLQGIITLIVAVLDGLAAFTLIFAAFAALMAMISMIMAMPFGPALYLLIFGHFERDGATNVMIVSMLLKLFFAGFLILAQQKFLENKGLVVLIVTALVANIVVTFLHGLVPGILVSITDAIAGIIVGILALVWAIWFALRSIPAVIKAI